MFEYVRYVMQIFLESNIQNNITRVYLYYIKQIFTYYIQCIGKSNCSSAELRLDLKNEYSGSICIDFDWRHDLISIDKIGCLETEVIVFFFCGALTTYDS